MSYREENGQVVLTMPREDYELLLMVMGMATAASVMHRTNLVNANQILALADRLNSGNPNYAPYAIEPKL